MVYLVMCVNVRGENLIRKVIVLWIKVGVIVFWGNKLYYMRG